MLLPPPQSWFDGKREGLLLGFGLGVSSHKFTRSSNNIPTYNNIFLHDDPSFMLDVQAGGYTMWNRTFGLQYYYNLGLSFDSSLKGLDSAYGSKADIFGLTATSTVNVDAIINAYQSQDLSIGFSAGLGLGFDLTHYQGKVSSMDYISNPNYDPSKPSTPDNSPEIETIIPHNQNATAISLDARLNLGMRLMFGKNFGVSFNCAIPFLPQSTGMNFGDGVISRLDSINFTTRFVYMKF